MSLNEGPRDPLAALWPDVSRCLLDVGVNRYRKPVTETLMRELSGYVGARPECLLMCNGADEVLYYLFTAIRRDSEDFVLTIAPTYPDYGRYARAVGLGMREVDLREDFLFEPSAVIEAAEDPRCRAVLVCNPNNPTGNLFPYQSIVRLIENVQCVLVIDEAYYEFSGVTCIDHALSKPHVILMRSFSKGFSAAGLRFGYAVGCRETVAELDKVRTFFNLGLITQAIALELLLHRREIETWNRSLIQERARVFREMLGMPGITPYTSEANFILFRVENGHRAIQNHLASRGFSVRDVSLHPLLARCLRVTIGNREENTGFLDALRDSLLREKGGDGSQ
jgi:histidinol-phosphate aminotransferase